MVVREIYARLGIKVDKKGHNQAIGMFTELHSKLELLHMAFEKGKEFIQELVGETVDYAKQINRTSRMTGVSTDRLQELGFVAHENGIEFGILQRSLINLQRHGFSKADEKLMNLVDTFDRVKDPAQRAAIAGKLFGKQYKDMLPILTMGGKKMREMMEEARELGIVLNVEDLQSADKLNKSLKKFHAITEGLKRIIGVAFLPILTKVVESVNEWVVVNREWLKEGIKEVLTDVVWVMRAFYNIGKAAYAVVVQLADMFGGWSVAVAALGAALLFAGESTTMLTLKWLAIGAVIAIITEDMLAYLKGQPSLIGDIAKALDAFWDDWSPETAKAKIKNLENHPIQAFLMTMLYTITHIQETWDEWVSTLTQNRAIRMVFGSAQLERKSKDEIQAGQSTGIRASPVGWAREVLADPNWSNADIHKELGLAGFNAKESSAIIGKATMPPAQAWGGGASPAASRAANAAAVSENVSPVVPLGAAINLTINAETGSSAEEIGSAAVAKLGSWWEAQVRNARNALVPSPEPDVSPVTPVR